MSANNGGPAFPTMKSWDENFCDEAGYARTRRLSGAVGGMTLRDYFAAKAMEGLIQSPDQVTEPFDGIAQSAYLMANEMLKARES